MIVTVFAAFWYFSLSELLGGVYMACFLNTFIVQLNYKMLFWIDHFIHYMSMCGEKVIDRVPQSKPLLPISPNQRVSKFLLKGPCGSRFFFQPIKLIVWLVESFWKWWVKFQTLSKLRCCYDSILQTPPMWLKSWPMLPHSDHSQLLQTLLRAARPVPVQLLFHIGPDMFGIVSET